MFSWLRRRDASIYPEDPVGDALYKTFPVPEKLPPTVVLWMDVYFATEAGADRMVEHLRNRRIDEIQRDYDADLEPGGAAANDPEAGFPWNIDFELEVPSQHRLLKHEFEGLERAVRDFGGRIGGFLVLEPDVPETNA